MEAVYVVISNILSSDAAWRGGHYSGYPAASLPQICAATTRTAIERSSTVVIRSLVSLLHPIRRRLPRIGHTVHQTGSKTPFEMRGGGYGWQFRL